MTRKLEGRGAVVTGSTSGIGLGIAEALASAGCRVMLNGFGDPGEVEALRRALAERHGVEVAYHGADMRRPEQIEDMVGAAEAAFGSLDVLVNNAGIQHTAPVHEFPVERWDAIIAINLSAVFHGTRAALPGMLARDRGRIINVASVHGLVGSVHKAAYIAAKHGVVGLTKVVALETAQTGITCNAICPGWVLTPLVRAQVEDRARREGTDFDAAKDLLLGEKQPSREFVTPEQLGELALFLCGDAAAQMRGQTLVMDGGWVAQ